MKLPYHEPVRFGVAVELLGQLGINSATMQKLCGRKKAPDELHMRYSPEDLLAVRAGLAGTTLEKVKAAMARSRRAPTPLVFRMTKGGVGKTGTSVNVAVALAQQGFRTLLCDADPQSSATELLGISTEDSHMHLGNFLESTSSNPKDADKHLPAAIIPIFPNGYLDLLPSDIDMCTSDALLMVGNYKEQRAEMFMKRNAEFLSRYDVIVFDTAPGSTPISFACMHLAARTGKMIVPMEPEGSCLRALSALQKTLDTVQTSANKGIDLRIIVNRYHPSYRHVDRNHSILKREFDDKLLDAMAIPTSTAFAQQFSDKPEETKPLVLNNPNNPAAKAIFSVTQAIIKDFGLTQPGLEAQHV